MNDREVRRAQVEGGADTCRLNEQDPSEMSQARHGQVTARPSAEAPTTPRATPPGGDLPVKGVEMVLALDPTACACRDDERGRRGPAPWPSQGQRRNADELPRTRAYTETMAKEVRDAKLDGVGEHKSNVGSPRTDNGLAAAMDTITFEFAR